MSAGAFRLMRSDKTKRSSVLPANWTWMPATSAGHDDSVVSEYGQKLVVIVAGTSAAAEPMRLIVEWISRFGMADARCAGRERKKSTGLAQ
jgi:hypothetical protein